jgi:hypothetical protein
MDVDDGDVQAACRDAGLADQCVRVYRFPGPHDARGSFLPPGLGGGLHPNLTAVQAADVEATVSCYRVAVEDNPQVPLAALLRHELEHCAQWSVCGTALFTLTEALDNALVVRHGSVRGLWEVRYVGPVEGDANAAASLFARGRFGDAACDALASTPDALLVGQGVERPDRDTVGVRQAWFAAVAGDALERALGRDPQPLIAALGANAVAAWEAAREDPEVRKEADAAVAATPTAAAARDADPAALADLWAPALAATRRAYERARAVNGV